ncbi:MAG: helix-turn-helix transcriptional regulator [Clostridia bacterium]|nr:helix-turn-helix transcriptional regulator [Clostridia bacterium]
MNKHINLGEAIKRQRLARGLTQEQLAEVLCVTPQTVSRWECGNVSPDIEMLAGMANFYGISLDELVDMNAMRSPDRLRTIFESAVRARSAGKLDEAEAILRDGLRLYPGKDSLMSELALTLTLKGTIDLHRSIVDEALELSERVLRDSTNEKVRSTTAANLVYLHLQKGDTDRAAALVYTLPHIYECREVLRAELAEDAGYPEALRQAIVTALTLFCEKIDYLPNRRRGQPDSILAQGMRTPGEDFAGLLQKVGQFLQSNL